MNLSRSERRSLVRVKGLQTGKQGGLTLTDADAESGEAAEASLAMPTKEAAAAFAGAAVAV